MEIALRLGHGPGATRLRAVVLRPVRLWHRLSLLSRFTITGFLLTLLIGAILGLGLSRLLEQDALEEEADRAAATVTLLLDPYLQTTDFTAPLGPERFAAIDRLIRERVLDQQIVRVKIWNGSGTVVYSDDQALVGQRFDVEDELAEALGGQLALEVSALTRDENLAERGQYARLMEIYAPIRLGGGPVVGAYELYRDLTAVTPRITALQRTLWLGLALGFGVLYFALFGLVYQASRELHRQGEELLAQAAERKRLEEQVRQAQKMEALGRMAGSIAHDFNNALSGIFGFGELLARGLASGDPLRSYADEILRASEHAAGLVRQLLAFSRMQTLQPELININGVATGMDGLLRRVLGTDIALVTELAPELARTRVDPTQIEQVLMNLTVNARDAMPQGGQLTIETANVDLDGMAAQQHATARPGAYVMLAVSDTGTGMDAETQAQIFEPFFTTKEEGKGTGLGLATVYGIVKQSGGDLRVESQLGRGTTFKIYLPCEDESFRAAA